MRTPALNLAVRVWPALITIMFPCAFAFLIYEPSVAQLVKIPEWTALQRVELSKPDLDFFAQNLYGLFLVGIGSGFLRTAAGAAVVLSTVILWRRLGSRAALAIIAAILLASLVSFAVSVNSNPSARFASLMKPLLRVIIDAAKGADPRFPVSYDDLNLAISLNLLALNAGASSLVAAFAAIAIAAAPGDLTAARLRERGRALEHATIMIAALLVFLTAVNKALVVWPQGLLSAGGQKTFGYVANGIATYWGAFGTGFLICVLVPTYLSLMADIVRAAHAVAGDSPKAQADWQKENGLSFDFKSGVFAAITAAAPILTGPGMDLLGRLLG
ncbi:MAG TPA: hypothetical protein VH436_36300 [Vicinamibacterales bacterium]|jgi:hypothetical protein